LYLPLAAQFKAFRFPKQTNQLAFVFDPAELGLSLSFGVEVFEPGHHTPLHVHRTGHELFFVLAGELGWSATRQQCCWGI
jgi:quercetin dioxygenase-like cupin family protein